jgi:CBS domain-containing protein
MTHDVITVTDDTFLEEAVPLMERHHVKRLPVVKGDAMVGIISRTNLVDAFIVGSSKTAAAPMSDAAIRNTRAARGRAIENALGAAHFGQCRRRDGNSHQKVCR